MTTKQKGNLTELQCLAGFVEQGYNVSIPYGEDSKYDFIADIEGKLIRVQVKTSSLRNGTDAIEFSCRSTHKNSSGISNIRYSANDVDYFATSWNNQIYLVPIDECSVCKVLRFNPPKNGQIKGISFAKDYELELQINKMKEEVAEH